MKLTRLAAGALTIIALVAAFALYQNRIARSSDHQDSPLTVGRPGTDITDVFLYPSPENSDNVVLTMDVHPLIPSGQGTSVFFDPGVMYQFKIAEGDDYHARMVLQFKASGTGADQTIQMYGPAAPNMQGVRSTFVAPTGTIGYNQTAALTGGIRAFAGPREDPFYFDLSQFFKIIPDRSVANQPNPPAPTAACFRKDAKDFLIGYNVLSLVVELPRKIFADARGNLPVIHIWATTSLGQNDASDDKAVYTQVERLARPAVKEATEDFKLHDITNKSDILDDQVLADSIKAFVMRPKPTGAGRSEAIANALVHTLIPDTITADLAAAGPARYLAVETNGKSGFPIAVIRAVPPAGIYGIKKALGDPYRHFGGRDLASPVIDLSLGAIFGSLVPKLGLAPEDNRETPCLTSDNTTPAAKHTTNTFPYVGAPQ